MCVVPNLRSSHSEMENSKLILIGELWTLDFQTSTSSSDALIGSVKPAHTYQVEAVWDLNFNPTFKSMYNKKIILRPSSYLLTILWTESSISTIEILSLKFHLWNSTIKIQVLKSNYWNPSTKIQPLKSYHLFWLVGKVYIGLNVEDEISILNCI